MATGGAGWFAEDNVEYVSELSGSPAGPLPGDAKGPVGAATTPPEGDPCPPAESTGERKRSHAWIPPMPTRRPPPLDDEVPPQGSAIAEALPQAQLPATVACSSVLLLKDVGK